MEETKRLRLTFFGSQRTRTAVLCKLERYFRRRGATEAHTDGRREITLRNKTHITLEVKPAFGSSREPFLEMEVTTTDAYLARSSAAVKRFAMNLDIPLDIQVTPLRPASER
ncbi:MAG: hypothetical protein U0R44_05500 [Candidatus Micrarchaeia archaeon]